MCSVKTDRISLLGEIINRSYNSTRAKTKQLKMLALFLQINLLISRTFSSFLSKSDSKGLFTGEDDRCFDCHLSQYKCLNWGNCSDISGRCLCSTGFGLNDCSGVCKLLSRRFLTTKVCGSLARTERPARGKDEKKCNCDDGWTGINCNGLIWTFKSDHLESSLSAG